MSKKPDGRSIIQEAKEKVKKEKQKEPITMKKTISVTIVSTLAVLATLVGMFYLGTVYGADQENKINSRVVSEAKALSTIAKPDLKQ